METKRKVPILNMDGSNPWNYYGSITNFVGFPIPLVALSAHIE